jgi:hypothetical protein
MKIASIGHPKRFNQVTIVSFIDTFKMLYLQSPVASGSHWLFKKLNRTNTSIK